MSNTTNTTAASVAANNCTILPDGSAFAVASFPLPKDHWLYAPREYDVDAEHPKELPSPILTHALRAEVVSAIRYAIRGATMCGKETDFDPDALVQNAVYALCGPYRSAAHVAPAQAVVPAGWKLVPVDATDEMVRATDEVNFENGDTDGTMHNVWNVMIAAAPAQPAAGASRFGSPELQAMIIARCVEKDRADSVPAGGYPPLPNFDSSDEPIWEAIFNWKTATPGADAGRKANKVENAIIETMRAYVDADRAALEATQASECGNCFEGETDRGHACRKCGGAEVVQAAPVGMEPVYQIGQPFLFDPENTWRDASKDAYDVCMPNRRRIIYTASQVQAMLAAVPRNATLYDPDDVAFSARCCADGTDVLPPELASTARPASTAAEEVAAPIAARLRLEGTQ